MYLHPVPENGIDLAPQGPARTPKVAARNILNGYDKGLPVSLLGLPDLGSPEEPPQLPGSAR